MIRNSALIYVFLYKANLYKTEIGSGIKCPTTPLRLRGKQNNSTSTLPFQFFQSLMSLFSCFLLAFLNFLDIILDFRHVKMTKWCYWIATIVVCHRCLQKTINFYDKLLKFYNNTLIKLNKYYIL